MARACRAPTTNLIELCNTGRWRHYYTQAQFLEEMRKVLHLRNRWAQLAGLPLSGETELQQPDLQELDLNSKQNDQGNPDAEPQVMPWRRAGERRRRPASAILAAVAGRL